MNYYSNQIDDVLKELSVTETGLVDFEAKKRLFKNGPNSLPVTGEKVTRFKIFLSQFTSPLIFILIFAGVISALLREFIDMSVIFVTVAINTFIGFIQEDKANEALKKLKAMIEYKAIVIRDGKKKQIRSEDLVAGDILMVEAGDKVQADGRIIKATNFEIDESALTGESVPVKKHNKILKAKVGLADRINMVFKGTIAINGRALVVVTAIGKDTELGKIASLVQDTKEEKTPLQIQLAKLGHTLAIIVLFLSVIIFFLGIFLSNGKANVFEMFQITVAMAVAAIPEGLTITLTVILAVGMRHILKSRSLVRKLMAAETLGSVSVICTDKTGTLTEGKMRITSMLTTKDDLDFAELKTLDPEKGDRHRQAMFALRIGVLCNDGVIENSGKSEREWKMIGDTTDLAFIHMGALNGLHKDELDNTVKRAGEIPFTSEHKYMATMHFTENAYVTYVKGAPEVLLKRCKYYIDNCKQKSMTKAKLDWFHEQVDRLSKSGLRVLALAYKSTGETMMELNDKNVDDLILVGLAGLSDPIRSDVKQTIELAHNAGIKTVMMTGDHVKTAQSIAKQIGLSDKMDQIFDGQKLEMMTDDELMIAVRHISIFARVDPIHKIRIVRAFQANGEVVAMTGDGVNDAPALKAADIGIALGSGTDVAKEVSDMILLDDSYSTIVASVEEGRGIYQNIKKVVLYLLASSFAEVGLIGASILAGLPLAVLPAQILWVNILEDSFPTMALAFDKGDRENMNDGPRRKGEPLLDKDMKYMVVIVSVISNAVLFFLYIYFLSTISDMAVVRTLMFIGLGIASLIYIYSIRSMRFMVWERSLVDNRYLNLALLFSWFMLVGAVYIKPLQIMLRTVPVGFKEWGIMIMFGVLNMLIIEIMKKIYLIKRNRAVV